MRGHRAYRTFHLQPGTTQGRTCPVRAEGFPARITYLLHLPSTNLETSPPPRSPAPDPAGSQTEVGLQKPQRNKSKLVSDRNRLSRSPPPLPYPRGAREYHTETAGNRLRRGRGSRDTPTCTLSKQHASRLTLLYTLNGNGHNAYFSL